MSHVTTSTGTGLQGCTSQRLRSDPFQSLRYHFGMLLGVEDLEVEQAYHRGKSWFHQAWQHGEGVRWGYPVTFDAATFELRIDPGLAVDELGRELALTRSMCVHLGDWFQQHRDDEGLLVTPNGAGFDFSVRLVTRFGACFDRPVPAITDSCSNTTDHTADSRRQEVPIIDVRPLDGTEAQRTLDARVAPFHLVRLLFGLADGRTDEGGATRASDQAVLDDRAAIASLAPSARTAAVVDAMRRAAARDTVESPPSAGAMPWPAVDGTAVTLADVHVTGLEQDAAGSWTVASLDIDDEIRPVILPTTTIHDLVAAGVGDTPTPSPLLVDRTSIARTAPNRIELEFIGAVLPNTHIGAVTVTALRGTPPAWTDLGATAVPGAVTAGDETRHAFGIDLATPTADDDLVRILIAGTGPNPVLDNNRRPLNARSAHDGADFVHLSTATDLD